MLNEMARPDEAVVEDADVASAGLPLVTIIVATFNAAESLDKCLRSIVDQTYPHKELIVIDGNSTDNTCDIIATFGEHIAFWSSEPDTGIYQAWNKALKRAKGDWICFLGADDYWSSPNSLGHLAEAAREENLDVISGKAAIIDREGAVFRVTEKPWNWDEMKRWFSIAHQSMLHARWIFQRHGDFDERYQIAGDYDLLLRLGGSARVRFVDEVVVCIGAYGKSRMNVLQGLRESRSIQSNHSEIGSFRATVNFYWAIAKWAVRKVLRLP